MVPREWEESGVPGDVDVIAGDDDARCRVEPGAAQVDDERRRPDRDEEAGQDASPPPPFGEDASGELGRRELRLGLSRDEDEAVVVDRDRVRDVLGGGASKSATAASFPLAENMCTKASCFAYVAEPVRGGKLSDGFRPRPRRLRCRETGRRPGCCRRLRHPGSCPKRRWRRPTARGRTAGAGRELAAGTWRPVGRRGGGEQSRCGLPSQQIEADARRAGEREGAVPLLRREVLGAHVHQEDEPGGGPQAQAHHGAASIGGQAGMAVPRSPRRGRSAPEPSSRPASAPTPSASPSSTARPAPPSPGPAWSLLPSNTLN